MSAITAHLDSIRTQVHKNAFLKSYAALVEEKTKVGIEYFIVGVLAVVAICVFSGFMANHISILIGFAYPAYASLVAIESTSKEDDTQWLTYWVVFAVFCLFENFVDYILYWLPFYYAIKVSFLVWCMIPKYNGALVVYNNVLKPAFKMHESAIDSALNAIDPTAAMDAINKEKPTEPETTSK
ncbi:receptor accessory protein 6 [Ochromonadaceae sp. CCMP2298]|nr:receptor accessory protein 6 [Ochromonadaceae sp. CCMP2298]|mmetsp:Transcript_28707/g.63743  ORF Transcript_28707/g.63743 Transcript_28707/m.63743 type:complete len:183 (-) Transcript_28707:192-740(-)|eukprot:CAMPEP_0173180878 /NCGR_PEP_ID=MMETSP1141-20130122/6967_1 /TAXON_ID=483371 /ORGANISM="non described non described, Strain CCMP2298" /LENGTH=182 /DNA_ID=CAMNT_0014103791 /DNA_START=51 /DNA_END=599 /DNA_ORIENTATION=-